MNLVWQLILLLPLLLLLQRQLHREIQIILFTITRRNDVSLALFSLLFFPGVLLHETSHFFMAKILRVPAVDFSIVPQTLSDGRLQLGYVVTNSTDIVRDTFIGLAPLLSGSLMIVYVAVVHLKIPEIFENLKNFGISEFPNALKSLISQPDFWLWLYLLLVISSTMFPSSSDRKSWLPIGLFLLFVFVILYITGHYKWIVENIGVLLNEFLLVFSFIIGVSVIIHSIFLLPLWAIRKILLMIFKLEIVQNN